MGYKPRESTGLNLQALIRDLGDVPQVGGQNEFNSNLVKGLWNLKARSDENAAAAAQAAVTSTFPEETQTFWVSGVGDDTNVGTRPDAPLKTLAAATAKCSASTRDLIIVTGTWFFQEDVVLPSYTQLIGSQMGLQGTIKVGRWCVIDIDRHYASATNSIMVENTTTELADFNYYRCNYVYNNYGGFTGVTTFGVNLASGSYTPWWDIEISYVTISSGGSMFSDSGNTVGIQVQRCRITEAYNAYTPSEFISLTTGFSTVHVDIGELTGGGKFMVLTGAATVWVRAKALLPSLLYDATASNSIHLDVLFLSQFADRIGDPKLWEQSNETVKHNEPSTVQDKTSSFQISKTSPLGGTGYGFYVANSAGAIIVTIPDDSAFDSPYLIGFETEVWHKGAGTVTARGGTGVTLNGNTEAGGGESDVVSGGQNTLMRIKKIAALEWVVIK
jgi:hypothetical protein